MEFNIISKSLWNKLDEAYQHRYTIYEIPRDVVYRLCEGDSKLKTVVSTYLKGANDNINIDKNKCTIYLNRVCDIVYAINFGKESQSGKEVNKLCRTDRVLIERSALVVGMIMSHLVEDREELPDNLCEHTEIWKNAFKVYAYSLPGGSIPDKIRVPARVYKKALKLYSYGFPVDNDYQVPSHDAFKHIWHRACKKQGSWNKHKEKHIPAPHWLTALYNGMDVYQWYDSLEGSIPKYKTRWVPD